MRSNSWPPNHAARAQLWKELCSLHSSETTSIYKETITDIFGSGRIAWPAGIYCDMPSPSQVFLLRGMVRTGTISCLQFIRSYGTITERIMPFVFVIVWLDISLFRHCYMDYLSSTWQPGLFEFECKYFAWLVVCTVCDDPFGTYWFVPCHRSTEVLQNQKCLVGCWCSEL